MVAAVAAVFGTSIVTDVLDEVVPWVEAAGGAIILVGGAIALMRMLRAPFMQDQPPLAALQIRLGFGLSLALGLEFLLAADILRTAVAPTWREIGELAAIAAIRTGLNFFLGREFIEGQRQIAALGAANLDQRFTGPPVPMHRKPAFPAVTGVDRDGAPDPSPDRRRGWQAVRDALAGPFGSFRQRPSNGGGSCQ